MTAGGHGFWHVIICSQKVGETGTSGNLFETKNNYKQKHVR